ncbi:hypothetical protein FNV43_RR16185 [Rhamnella rubrinervis]|uniref:RNA uridylyltransferase n=1 Tax=Rhamnella rubrinervis TaxID=2594499 RepID=A0A8K0GXD5_9ROSA|nr:hypothetical protein FNV43_RR16185 [Rhamnella rubrinervis]
MSGGGNDPPAADANGGEFLLSLLQKTNYQNSHLFQSQTRASHPPLAPPQPPAQQHQQQPLVLDPAVAAVGPTLPFPPTSWPSNGRYLPHHHLHWPTTHGVSPPYPPNGFPALPHTLFHPPGNQFPGNQIPSNDDLRRLGFSGGNSVIHGVVQQKQQVEHKLKFGSFPSDFRGPEGLLNLNNSLDTSKLDNGLDRNGRSSSNLGSNSSSNFDGFRHGNYDSWEQERRGGGGSSGGGGGRGKQYSRATPPPGFPSNPSGGGNRTRGLNRNVDWGKTNSDELIRNRDASAEAVRIGGDGSNGLGLGAQLDRPGPPSGSNLHSVSGSDIEESLMNLENGSVEARDGDRVMKRRSSVFGAGAGERDFDEIGERLVGSLLIEDESNVKNESKQHQSSREKDSRSDTRGQRLLSQRMRTYKRQMQCRSDIERLNAPFLAIVESLIPAEEEKAKQKQFLTLLKKLISKEWPEAQLFLYGSCANSFELSNSDIDLCLAIGDSDINKSEVLLKLADILQSDNLQNVQALTRARVPIVKLMDPATGISCDICINNVLAVVNTRLLGDYARIDARLQQLAFIVKHWAKSRGVNETYQGTLSSYAYVLMCIHFLQQRKPAILPCLQGMEPTYCVTIDDMECAYFDQVEKLYDFGSRNRETIALLAWEFFNYWAYRHDYTDTVISVRTGNIISKRAKDWTRRVGNDRHLICIEDPFETSHDLGRVVDKYSIRVLREEFERAADIMQNDPNPCVKLFEPYVPC